MGLLSASRDIFLDNETDIEHIHLQFKKAITIAEKYGSAIVIGHPYKTTIRYLEHVLPQLEGTHISVHKISDLLKTGITPRPNSARDSKPANTPNLDAFIEQYLRSVNTWERAKSGYGYIVA